MELKNKRWILNKIANLEVLDEETIEALKDEYDIFLGFDNSDLSDTELDFNLRKLQAMNSECEQDFTLDELRKEVYEDDFLDFEQLKI